MASYMVMAYFWRCCGLAMNIGVTVRGMEYALAWLLCRQAVLQAKEKRILVLMAWLNMRSC